MTQLEKLAREYDAEVADLTGKLFDALKEIERLQRIIDSRPAINAGLPESYVLWSQSIYELEFVRATGAQS